MLQQFYILCLSVVVALGLCGCAESADTASDTNAQSNSDETPTETTDATAESEACIDGNDSGLTDPQNSIPTLEDGRYCEVLVIYMSDEGIMLGDVWNSLALGTCPQELWEELDTETISADFPDALVIRLNGPRYFLMQHLMDAPSQLEVTVHDFGGIAMIKAATVEINPAAQNGYTPITVNRDNTWRFDAGNRVHELIDTEGNVYTMQSFSRIVDEALSYEDLETLGDRLNLPDGWRYRVRMLDEDLDVQAIGTATVLQDELQNTYQWRADCQIDTGG